MLLATLFAGLFSRTTPVGTIILGVCVLCVGLYGLVTGQCLVVTDWYGAKGRIISALAMAVGGFFIWIGVNRL
jgi:hypothetical protein